MWGESEGTEWGAEGARGDWELGGREVEAVKELEYLIFASLSISQLPLSRFFFTLLQKEGHRFKGLGYEISSNAALQRQVSR